jgi:hypothetical protein
MTLADWDREVRPHLHFIESGAAMAARHARLLSVKPGFETIAETELSQAEEVLRNALTQISGAKALYHAKPSEQA